MKRLRFLLLAMMTALFFPISGFAVALPIDLNGTYSFQGQIEPLMAIDNILVYGFTEKGQTQLQDLSAQGYDCSNTGRDIYRCKKNLASTNLPASIQTRLKAKYAGLSIEFAKLMSPPHLDNDADDVKQWNMDQKVIFGSKNFNSYEYRLISDKVHKIILGEPGANDAIYFVINAEKSLQYLFEEIKQKPDGYIVYRGFVNLQP